MQTLLRSLAVISISSKKTEDSREIDGFDTVLKNDGPGVDGEPIQQKERHQMN